MGFSWQRQRRLKWIASLRSQYVMNMTWKAAGKPDGIYLLTLGWPGSRNHSQFALSK